MQQNKVDDRATRSSNANTSATSAQRSWSDSVRTFSTTISEVPSVCERPGTELVDGLNEGHSGARSPAQAEFALDLAQYLDERKTAADAHHLMVREHLAGNRKAARLIADTILETVDLEDLPARTVATCYLAIGIKDGKVFNLSRVQMAVQFFTSHVQNTNDRTALAKNLKELHCLKRMMWAAEAEADKKARRRQGSGGQPALPS